MARVNASFCACEEEFVAYQWVKARGTSGGYSAFSLLPFIFISYSHLGRGAFGAIGAVGSIVGLGTGITEQQSDLRVVHVLCASQGCQATEGDRSGVTHLDL